METTSEFLNRELETHKIIRKDPYCEGIRKKLAYSLYSRSGDNYPQAFSLILFMTKNCDHIRNLSKLREDFSDEIGRELTSKVLAIDKLEDEEHLKLGMTVAKLRDELRREVTRSLSLLERCNFFYKIKRDRFKHDVLGLDAETANITVAHNKYPMREFTGVLD